MRNILGHFLFLLIGLPVVQAQNAFEHARILREFVVPIQSGNTNYIFDTRREDGLLDICSPILSAYPAGNQLESGDELLDAYDGNPFLGDAQRQVKILFPNDFQASVDLERIDTKQLPRPAKGLSVTNLADGLAKFLVKRTKEELGIAFFQRFKDAIENQPNLRNLFPQTANILRLIDKDVYQFQAYLEALRTRFIKDMKTLDINLQEALEETNLIKEVRYQLIAKDVLHVAGFLINGASPVELIDYLSENAHLQIDPKVKELPLTQQKTFTDVASGFKVVALISNSLRKSDGNQTWVNPKEVIDAFKDPVTFYIYLGLLWQNAEGVVFSDGKSMRQVLGEMAEEVNKLENMKTQVVQFVEHGAALKTSSESLVNKIEENQAVYDDYYKVFYESFELLETGIDFKKTFLPLLLKQGALDEQILRLLRQLNELNFNIRQKHYSAGVINVISVLDELLGADFTFKEDVLKYGNFIAIVAEAEDADEVTAAIEAVALPSGSSIIKKRSKFSVALNAYTGLAGGIEFLEARPDDNKWITGVSAPIGFSFNAGLGSRGSVGLYVPLIDVGAVTAFRFGDSTTDDLPELNIQNILAPGAYLIYGWGKDIPFTIGLGTQLGPNLRNVDNGQNTIQSSGWRFGVVASIDIPVFNLFVR